MSIIYREDKDTALTWAEADGNFRDLDQRLQELEQAPGGVASVAGVSPDGTGNVPAAGLKTALAVPTQASDIGAATAAQGNKADTAVQPGELSNALDDKVDKVPGKGLSQENFTTAEKTKLAGLEGTHWRGNFTSLAALQTAIPVANPGDYADVDNPDEDIVRYIWDNSDAKWVAQQGTPGTMTPAEIKTAYESNPDTNAFTDAEQAKLASVDVTAQPNYPLASQAQAEASEGVTPLSWTSQRIWQAIAKWWTTSSDKTKLDGIQANATANPNTDSLAEGSTNQYFTSDRVKAVTLSGLSTATNAAIVAADSILVALGKLQAQINAGGGGSGGPTNTDGLPEGSSNLYFTVARVRATLLDGLSFTTNAAIAATDSVLTALGKLQAQLSGHIGSGDTAHSAATTSVAGFMSASDKTKLDGIADGAQVNYPSATQAEMNVGTESGLRSFSPLRVRQGTNAWWINTTYNTKLMGIQEGATANSTDAQLRDRSTHTGTQPASTISDFASSVLGTVLSGFSAVATGAVAATDTILLGMGKLQAQVSLLMTATHNVVKYGVVADDPSKADANDAAIAAAIAAGAKGLYFPAGVYYINNIQVPTSFKIVGDGFESSILSFVQANRPNRSNMLTSAGAVNGFVMRDIQLRGNRAFQTTASVTGQDCYAIYFRNGSVQNVFIDHCSIRQFGDSASANVGGSIVLGATTGTSNLVANIHINDNYFAANGNIPAVYINCDANFNAALCRNIHVCRNNINVTAAGAHNAIYILGGSVTIPAYNIHVDDNDFYVTATIDTLIELNYAQGFSVNNNKATITGSATVVGLLVRDSMANGSIDGNSLINLGSGCANTNGISVITLGSATQSNLTICRNQVKGWAIAGSGKGIAVMTTSANVKVSQNYVGGNTTSALTSVGISVTTSSNIDIFDNTFECCMYVLEIGPVDGLRFIRNTLIAVGDNAFSAITGTASNINCTNVQIAENKVRSRIGTTPFLVTLSSSANTGNRIECNYMITGMGVVNDSSRDSFEAIVLPPASGTIIAGDVYRFSQGSIDVANGVVITIGGNLDGTLDGIIGGACVIGDTVLVAPPGDVSGCVVSATVTATNRIRVKLANMSGAGASISAGNWTITIIRTSRM